MTDLTLSMGRVWSGFALFGLLSFLLLGLIPLVDLAAGGGLMDFAAQAGRASEATGIAWTSSLLDIARLALVEPGLWLLVFGSAVPMLAALIVIMRQPGWIAGVFMRLRPFGPETRHPLRAYAFVIAASLLALLATGVIRSVLYDLPPGALLTHFTVSLLPAALLAGLLDQGALLEEGGWRGFANPLLEQVMSPLAASLLVGLLWALWHLPRDITGGVLADMGGAAYALAYFPSFLLGALAVSVIAVWGMQNSGGSIWPAVLVHGLANDATGLAGTASMDVALTAGYQLTKALPFAAIAMALVVIYGRNLRPSGV